MIFFDLNATALLCWTTCCDSSRGPAASTFFAVPGPVPVSELLSAPPTGGGGGAAFVPSLFAYMNAGVSHRTQKKKEGDRTGGGGGGGEHVGNNAQLTLHAVERYSLGFSTCVCVCVYDASLEDRGRMYRPSKLDCRASRSSWHPSPEKKTHT